MCVENVLHRRLELGAGGDESRVCRQSGLCTNHDQGQIPERGKNKIVRKIRRIRFIITMSQKAVWLRLQVE